MIQMTHEQLVEYTERVAKAAVEQTTPKRAALRNVLTERGSAIRSQVTALDRARHDERWLTTPRDLVVISRAIAPEDVNSVAGLRLWIKTGLNAIDRLEKARERTVAKNESDRLKRHRELDRKQARHEADGHTCSPKLCDTFNTTMCIDRLVADAPPLSTGQRNTLRALLG